MLGHLTLVAAAVLGDLQVTVQLPLLKVQVPLSILSDLGLPSGPLGLQDIFLSILLSLTSLQLQQSRLPM